MCDEDLIRSNRDLVIAAAMSHVAFDGWTWKAIKTGAIDAGFTEADAARLFIGGLGDAADHFADWAVCFRSATSEEYNSNKDRPKDWL